MKEPSIASQSLAFSGLFEVELLVELMLRYWGHPFADDAFYRGQLLETAVGVLKASAGGETLMETVPPHQVNLVLAIWYAEWNSVTSGDKDELDKRTQWLEAVKRAVPSCFCDQSNLGESEPP